MSANSTAVWLPSATILKSMPAWNGHVIDPRYIPKNLHADRDSYVGRLSKWLLENEHLRSEWPVWVPEFVKAERQRLAEIAFPQLGENGGSPNPLEVPPDHPDLPAYRAAVNRWCADFLAFEAFWPHWVPAYAAAAREHARKVREQQIVRGAA